MQMSLGHFIGQWLEILRKLSGQNWNAEKLLLATSRVCIALLHAFRILIVVVGDIREGSNYIVYHNTNYSN